MTMKTRKSRGLFVRAIPALLALCIGLLPRLVRANGLDLPPSADFTILNGDGSKVVGYSHYGLSSEGDGSDLLSEEDRFLDGQYDIEHDKLRASGPGKLASVVAYEHDYFDADGSLERVAKADFRTGEASCTIYENGRPQVSSSKLDFPPDTYPGSTVLIPLAHYLREGSKAPLRIHNFNCVPAPTVLSVKADTQSAALWSHYPGQLVEVRLKPDFGWLTIFVAPFVPVIDAWFDPSEDWVFVGAKFGRFYKGPEMTFIRVPSKSRAASRGMGKSPNR